MPVLVAYAALLLTPAAAFWLAARALDRLAAWNSPRRPGPMPSGPSLERLVEDLRRLEREYLRIERSDLPARGARLRTVSLAYDDTLRACCRALDLPEPDAPPLDGLVRLETEAALAQRGLNW